MRLHDFILINESQQFSESLLWSTIDGDIREAIDAIVWPPGSDKFVVPPVGHGNGVKPIKAALVNLLHRKGWEPEQRVSLVADVRPGPVDAVTILKDGTMFVLEWETGNVSSSHRSVNKILIATSAGLAVGGALVVARRDTLYPLLTDRVGNDRELMPYFDLWSSYPLERPGLLCMYVVDYDDTDEGVEPIPKMTDGWALLQRREP